MVPSGPTVGVAPEPSPSLPDGGAGATTGVPSPGNSPKRNVHRTLPSVRPAAGGAMAYSLSFMLATYTVPSWPSAGDALRIRPVWAVHKVWPVGEIANNLPAPLVTYTVPSGPSVGELDW